MICLYSGVYANCLVILLTLLINTHTSAHLADNLLVWPPAVIVEPVLDGNDPAALLLSKSMSASLLGDLDTSLVALKAAVQRSPSEPELMIQLSLALCAVGEIKSNDGGSAC